MTWFGQSVWAAVILTPCWLATPFFERNFGIKADVYVVWYFFGIALSVSSYITTTDSSGLSRLFPSWQLVAAIIAVGATIGAIANVLVFTATTTATNAALVSTIAVGGGGALLFLSAYALGELVPKYFGKTDVNWPITLGSMAFIIIGVVGLAFAKR
ncbi:MAG: hypothetical protein V4664_03910 [Patescibacteria group bacterium]